MGILDLFRRKKRDKDAPAAAADTPDQQPSREAPTEDAPPTAAVDEPPTACKTAAQSEAATGDIPAADAVAAPTADADKAEEAAAESCTTVEGETDVEKAAAGDGQAEVLSPTEILMLFYAENYSQDQQFFEGFWYYDYQLQDPYPTLQMLWEQGYLQLGDLTGTLQRETAANLRQLLRRQGLPTSGNKQVLVQRLLDSVGPQALQQLFPHRRFCLTEKGQQIVAQNPGIYYAHTHPNCGVDICTAHQLCAGPQNHLTALYAQLEKKARQQLEQQDWAAYRTTRFGMSQIAQDQDDQRRALRLLAEVLYCDLYQLGADAAAISRAKLPTGTLRALRAVQRALELSDRQLHEALTEEFSSLLSPRHELPDETCADIVLDALGAAVKA